MTINEAVALLNNSGIENASFDVSLLAEHFAGLKRHELVFMRNSDISSPAFSDAVVRRSKRVPLQYILGSWYFYGREFLLNADCLIPRADTEITVETAVKMIRHGGRFCDIGTGSGAIALSVLCERPDLTAVATDLSPGALSAARENAVRLGVADRVEMMLNDILKAPEALTDAYGGFDAVVSNPPYIPSGVIPGLEPELAYEPHAALDGGEDGLVFYRSIIDSCAGDMLKPGGILIFEAGIDEAAAIADYAVLHSMTATFYKDLGGIDRTVLLKKEGTLL